MMRVVDYINQADPKKVIEHYLAQYKQDGWATVESFNKFKSVLNDIIAIDEGDGFFIVIRHIVRDWTKYKSTQNLGRQEYNDVSGRHANDDTNWAIEFVPWGQWKNAEVQDLTKKNLTVDQIAFELYYEMTWAGWPEQIQEKFNDILDAKEKLDRALESGDMSGYTQIYPPKEDK